MMFHLYRISVAAALALIGTGVAWADPRGLWLAQDGARVHVSTCGAGLCATLASTKTPVDPATGAPWTDRNNPNPAERSRPLVGVYVLYGMMPDGAGRWSGSLYNTDNGQTYSGHLIEIDRNTLRIEGCVIGICGGQNMRRLQ